MKIVHYGLGFPPERSGGLVKYSLSLIKEQINSGHDVILVYPGRFNLMHNKQPYFKSGIRQSIPFAELINALPLPLIGNIKNPDDFMTPANIDIFLDFLTAESPDVIHLHTLMGLYAEFLVAAKQLNIKVVFTTHDFFGISPNPKFYLDGHDFVDDSEYDIWNNIREYGSPTTKLRLVQLSVYPYLRKWIKKFKKSMDSNKEYIERIAWSDSNDAGFQNLKYYYLSLLQNINVVHFNSNISKQVYKRFLPKIDWQEYVVPITSDQIKQNSEVHLSKNEIKAIAYIGPYTQEKGFFDFIKIAEEFVKSNPKNRAIVMGDERPIFFENIINFGRYNQEQMTQLLKDIDLVVLPSRWHETFGLIAIEVLATGTKVIVSEKMGIKDFIPDWCQIKIEKNFDLEFIAKQQDNLEVTNVQNHAKKILELYVK